jgi:shikimate kinase
MKAGMHILLINPNTSAADHGADAQTGAGLSATGALLHGATAERGAAMITDEAG